MLNGLAAYQYNPHQTYAAYGSAATRGATVQAVRIPAAQPEVPVTAVQPVRPTPAVQSAPLDKSDLFLRLENDPAAMAVRGRIQSGEDAQTAQAAGEAEADSKSVQETAEEAECQTCKERKYQDGSDDPGVSFKTASHIDPDQAASVVRGHEQEHVVREQAKAGRENREVVSQSVTLHTGICPECGRTYISGGTTQTVTRAKPETPEATADEESQRDDSQAA